MHCGTPSLSTCAKPTCILTTAHRCTRLSARSNRSAALLKLSKASKALADAEECIKLRPEWEKGFFRKAAALEVMDKLQEVGTV